MLLDAAAVGIPEGSEPDDEDDSSSDGEASLVEANQATDNSVQNEHLGEDEADGWGRGQYAATA